MLSLDAGSPVLFEGYRETLLDEHLDEPQLWPLTAFYFDKFMAGRLFRGNYHGSHIRIYHGFREWQKRTEVRPRKFLMKLKNLDGAPVQFPHADKDKINAVVFMEPPANGESAKLQVDFMKRLEALSTIHFHTNINYLAAFLSENTNAVNAVVRRNGWKRGRVAIVPDGLENPHVVRLGVFLAAERPNTFTVAPDGTITWSMSGMYQMAAGANGVVDTVKGQVWKHDIVAGQAALDEGDFKRALRLFRGSFPPERFTPAAIKTAQRRGRATAHKGLGEWEAALKEFDSIVADHTVAATRAPCACHSLARKLRSRADMLEKLGRKAEADGDRRRAGHLACPREGTARFHTDRYEQELFNKLKGFAYRKDWQGGSDYIDVVIAQGKDGRQRERETFARVLRERAETLAKLGEKKKAQQDRDWADSLTKDIEVIEEENDGTKRSRSYVDVLNEER